MQIVLWAPIVFAICTIQWGTTQSRLIQSWRSHSVRPRRKCFCSFLVCYKFMRCAFDWCALSVYCIRRGTCVIPLCSAEHTHARVERRRSSRLHVALPKRSSAPKKGANANLHSARPPIQARPVRLTVCLFTLNAPWHSVYAIAIDGVCIIYFFTCMQYTLVTKTIYKDLPTAVRHRKQMAKIQLRKGTWEPNEW